MDFIEPLTATERTIAVLWSELLDFEPIGRQDDFFELGGNSMLAVRFVQLVQSRLDVPLEAGVLSAHPTLEAICLHIDERATGLCDTRLGAAQLAEARFPFLRR